MCSLISHVGTLGFSPAWRTESSLSASRSPWIPQMLRAGSRATMLRRQITISCPTVRTHFLSELADSQLWTPTSRNCVCPLLCGTKHVPGSHQLLACWTQPWVHPRELSTEQLSFVSYKSSYPHPMVIWSQPNLVFYSGLLLAKFPLKDSSMDRGQWVPLATLCSLDLIFLAQENSALPFILLSKTPKARDS